MITPPKHTNARTHTHTHKHTHTNTQYRVKYYYFGYNVGTVGPPPQAYRTRTKRLYGVKARFLTFISEDSIKGYIFQKLLLACIFLYKQKMFFITVLYEQFIHLSYITLRPNIQLLSNPQHAYQSF